MKNLIAGVLVLCVIIGMMLMCDYIENHYTLEVVVTDVDSDVVTVETQTGRQYQYVGDGVRVGDSITAVMYTNHTNSRTDDVLQAVK
jgi:hypothetical protein